MDSITLKCPAKINLSLDVLGKRDDGYHEISTIMQTVSLEDKITIKKSNKFSIESNNKNIPLNDENIALKAAKLMFKKAKLQGGVSIYIEKNIPVAAGLAGGSSNAAGVILGINAIYSLNSSKKFMSEVASFIGSDIAYLLEKGTALCKGRGEIVEKLKPLRNHFVLIAKPDIDISTKWVYSNLNIDNIKKRPSNELLIDAIKRDDIEIVSNNLVNVLEEVTISKCNSIKGIKDIMINYGALGVLMSGSGPSVFGIFNEKDIKVCYEELRKDMTDVYITKMI